MPRKRERLQRARDGAGLSQEEFAYRVGVDRSTVGRWESGKSKPQPWQRRKIAKHLGVTLPQLDEILDEAVLSAATSAPSDLPAAAAEQEADISFAPRSGRADPAAVRAVTAQVEAIAKRYETEPSASLVADVGQSHATLSFLLGQGGSERTQRELHQAATTSAALLGQLVWDASGRRDGVMSSTYCDAAIAHAAECGDHATAAYAELRKAYVHLYGLAERRDPRAGLIGAQTAAHQSQHVSHALYGLSQLHVGEAFAMLGEYRQCEQALSAAEDSFGRVGPDDVAADTFSAGQFGRLAGSCYLSLGHPERAEHFLTSTAELLHDRPKTRSLVLGNLALCYIRQRQLDTATATLHAAIDLLEHSRGGGGMSVVFTGARELYPWRETPAVQDVHDRLLGLMARA